MNNYSANDIDRIAGKIRLIRKSAGGNTNENVWELLKYAEWYLTEKGMYKTWLPDIQNGSAYRKYSKKWIRNWKIAECLYICTQAHQPMRNASN